MKFNIMNLQGLSESAKNFAEAISKFLAPDDMDKMLFSQEMKIVERISEQYKDSSDILPFLINYKEIRKFYKNKVDIAKLAVRFFEESESKSKVDEIDETWLNLFFEKAKIISNEGAKVLWGKVLAAEAAKPHSISLSLLNSISFLSEIEAMEFGNLCRFAMRDKGTDHYNLMLFITRQSAAYKKSGIDRGVLSRFERLGLIDCEYIKEFTFNKRKVFGYGNHNIIVDAPDNGIIESGNVIFTKDGHTLYKFIDNEFKSYNASIMTWTLNEFLMSGCRVTVDGELYRL